ncbi:killer toxin [Cryphonectria parasitica EP155]|uniref:Killer toxin n=1 Tax=Cryphonectria parasitica (strain ATCC 38755 / EP155) TaxID=660469 RepID=A0A9P4XXQ3_CRYP1|nr:killer toxin [Cryphonectria parasitica EP155]KAF3762928.1 killer toxin [Cryphonectria parasitica EP155]
MPSLKTALLLSATSLISTGSALGINCRGSGLCTFATIENHSGTNIVQLWHDVLNTTTVDGGTTYSNGDHVVCIGSSASITVGADVGAEFGGASGSLSLSSNANIGTGGVCLFPQNMADGATITLESIRSLVDALGEHGCTTCGSVPIHYVDQGSNSPSDGILTSNYVGNPFCDDNCITSVGST